MPALIPLWFYRLGLIIGVSVLLALQYRFWVGEGSYAHIHSLQGEIETIKIENAKLSSRNNALQARIDGLKNGTAAIEASARYDLGLVKENEIFLRLPKLVKKMPYANPQDASNQSQQPVLGKAGVE